MTKDNIVDVLKIYENIRKPISQDIAERSLKMGHLMEFHPDYLPKDVDVNKVKAGDPEHLGKVGQSMHDVWSFHYSKMPGEDWEHASEMLNQILGGRV